MKATAVFCLGPLLACFVSLALPGHSAELKDHVRIFPSGATVVLLAGLPGDVESENAYREEMQDWLQIISLSGQIQSVFCLSDFAESLKPPANLAVQFFKSDRSSFQKLGTTLAELTNAVVFIAWGHGGRQGSTPVFHVHGPRLTPADFAGLKFSSPQSHWVLMFRGSGAFAAELAGPERMVLASESGTMFNSDPISMGLLLKIVRGNPGISFENAAEQLGAASSAWFADRHLVASEEPTLWAGQEKPRVLTSALKENPLASQIAAKPKDQASAAKTNLQADLPAAWKGIVREDSSRFPGADAVVLRAHVHSTLANNPALSTEQEEFIQVLTVEGKRFGDFDIGYNPPYEEINFLDCEVLSPNGKLTRLDPDTIREAQQESVGEYHVGRRKMFSLPGVVPGAILHVRHKTDWQKFPFPHASMEIPVGRDLPCSKIELEVTVPADATFHFAFEKIIAADPLIQRGNYGSTYSWRFENVPAPVHEQLSAPGQNPRLLISTFPDWADFASWYGRICKLTDEVTPEIVAKAEEMTHDCKDDREKIAAIYGYVTRLRYVAVPLGVNSLRPHSAANVLQNQFGDCKDKANLFNTLLRALNIQSHLVLVPRFGQAHEDLPGLAFNHAISKVVIDKQPVWVDTTDDVCRFGLLPPGDPGRKVLVIDGKTTSLVQVPAPVVQEHVLRIKGTVDCAKTGGRLPMQLQSRSTGYSDYELRTAAQQITEHLHSAPLLAKVVHPVAGLFALEAQSSTPVSALEEDFSCNIQGDWIGGTESMAGQSCLRSPFWIPNQWNLALHRRKTPLYLNEGYPLAIEEQFDITLPPETRTVSLPALSASKTGPLRWQMEWNRIAENKLTAQLNVELPLAELSFEETTQFQKQLIELFSALSASARFSSVPKN